MPDELADATSLYGERFYDGLNEGSLDSAHRILPLALRWTGAASVIDVGCGQGAWLAAALDQGVARVVGVDGAHVSRDSLLIPSSCFDSRDLSSESALRDLGRFDLALCLEVAEHLPESRADSLVRDLTHLAPVVLFSAAVPRQGGTHHINEQWPSYWVARFGAAHYRAIDIRPLIWSDPGIEPWYRQNCILFVAPDHTLRETPASPDSVLDLVHPELFLGLVRTDPLDAIPSEPIPLPHDRPGPPDPPDAAPAPDVAIMGPRALIAQLPHAVARAIARRLRRRR